MEPLSTTTIRRPFHWGLVVCVGPEWSGEYPEVDPNAPVTASDRVLLIPVRHAQDSDVFEDQNLVLAQAEVVVRRWARGIGSWGSHQAVFRGRLELPSGHLTVGDADEWVTIPVSPDRNTVLVSYDAGAPRDTSPDRVWVDLVDADSA